MEPISQLVKSTLPNYLSNLPIPDTFGGWFKLSFKDWLALVPPTAVVAGIGYAGYLAFCPAAQRRCSPKSGRCNETIRKHEAKVVDMIDVEDIAEKAAFCRCWKTKNWPYCDGSHGEHNKQTGDNVGPVVVKKK
ncbi:CDGSH iron-sulfur domain-containing protein 2 homolog [Drosophila sulfurigaster albostrigata]|uniref:CDGSH iron-sulfur domain-containing protein 2 homologue n=1 Tax=Drosophila albomicans TaxID=7291 RepID=A0A6P8XJ64_DROAB|nr:CDGSH iron-sulfur domain-containing protein 2 homolog [Drosophila albomicans]XP_060648805.1 CDGSH iron-sulfur domain-containing protein 2 homolog [Drosophila nasuta]XP_062124925.1 CDGSH iron-sulfur domain-containing protein 2 homolog [Drosophila sulfurigaster albostrigata]